LIQQGTIVELLDEIRAATVYGEQSPGSSVELQPPVMIFETNLDDALLWPNVNPIQRRIEFGRN